MLCHPRQKQGAHTEFVLNMGVPSLSVDVIWAVSYNRGGKHNKNNK